MALHLIKLCVGVSEIEWLETRAGSGRPLIVHTRMTPKRAAEIEDGGSLYWVIKGQLACRQRLVDVRPFTDAGGIGRCRLVLEPLVFPVRPRPYRPFQGWRYLEPDDAPPDLEDGTGDVSILPEPLRRELVALGLL